MPIFRVDSVDDPRVEPYRSLKTTNRTRRTGEFIVEGEKLVDRLVEFRWPIDSVFVAEPRLEKWKARLPESIDIFVAPYDLMQSIVGFHFHRGALACSRRPASFALDRLSLSQSGPLLLVACIDVHDPENVGAILRTSQAFGVKGAVLTSRCADPFSRRVLRTSMGAPLSLPLAIVGDLAATLAQLRNDAIELAAAVLDPSATPLPAFRVPARLALLLGNEGAGLDPWIVEQCPHRITIPMSHSADSLNVAVAAGILLHELTTPTRNSDR